MKEILKKAIKYEEEKELQIKEKTRPVIHLSSRVGWMNDPNGFSYYKGKYHMFYQYYPYNTHWGPMHWGHAVSEDLIKWTYEPVAIAPDEEYDSVGCFSGSAIELPTGEHLLLYTGVTKESKEENAKDIQTQCIAVGDGKTYKKHENNPVLTEETLPTNCSKYDFRDPKIWFEDGMYYCVVGSCTEEKDGQILLYNSSNGFDWNFEKVLIENKKRYGRMWECPDFFELNGKHMLITSPQDMLPEGLEFHNGNGTLYFVGNYDKNHNFSEETCGTIDYGIDFYAPQTVLSPDGRRIMIGWMQNWDTLSFKPEYLWFGQMSIPREVTIKEHKMFQAPVREIEKYYGKEIIHQNVLVSNKVQLPEVQGRCVDLFLEIKPSDEKECYKNFEIRVADDGANYTSIIYEASSSILKLDRKHSGTRRATVHQRRAYVKNQNGKIKLRILLDRFSMEVFINDGEQVMSMTFYTDLSAEGINFIIEGKAFLDVAMHELKVEML
ncbi:MAG: glycoside hydrolase family 32 protein [Lachnospiraceae bacterium]